MIGDIERELVKAEQALYVMQGKYPKTASRAANARYVYDQAWATAVDEIAHRAVAEGKKPPTVAAIEAEATLTVKEEMREARYAEADLDAVTALSGSGPAYVFYFLEAMTEAGAVMGLPRDQAYELAVATFIGAGELAKQSSEPPEILRQRVTSKGGTTYAALTSMEDAGIKAAFVKAMQAAQIRARELGDEFGKA